MLSENRAHEVWGQAQDSPDVTIDVTISIEQCFHGHVTTVSYDQEFVTPTSLVQTRRQEKEVVLSPGIPDNYEMRFAGEGHHGLRGKRSDLVVRVKVARDETWARKGANLVMIYSLTLAQALKAEPLSFKVFSHGGPDKTVNWPVDEILTPKTAILIPDHGLPVFTPKGEKLPSGAKEFGDLIVRFNIEFPRQLPGDRKEKIIAILNGAS